MDLRLLKYFIAVYEEKNISKASERLHVSQPSLTTAIKNLEDDLGFELFIRHKRGVDLTAQAHQLYSRAKRLVEESESIKKYLIKESKLKTLTIAIMPDIQPSMKAKIYSHLTSHFPETKLKLVGHFDEADFRLTLREFKTEKEMFVELYKEPYVFCVHQDHPLAKKELVKSSDLVGENFLECPPCESHEQTINMIEAGGDEITIRGTTNSKSEILALLLGNCGVSFLPRDFASEYSQIKIRPFDGPLLSRELGIALRPEIFKNQEIYPLIESIKTLYI